MAPPVQPLTAAGIIKRRIKTPGEVFGEAVKHKTYIGTIVKRDKPRGDPPAECVTVRYDDGQKCWFPVTTVSRWLLPVGSPESAGAESEDLSDSSDPDEDSDSDSEAGQKVVPVRPAKAKAVESAEEKRARLDFEEHKKSVTQAIHSRFVEKKRTPTPDIEFKPSKGKPSSLFHDPPCDNKPGLLKTFVSEKPRNIEEGMFYVFGKLLPKSYWIKLSNNSVKYAVFKKAGEDSNADKDPDDRFQMYKGKGKQRPWDPKWVSPNGLLLFHQSLLLMTMNKRNAAMDHFSLDNLLRSILAEQYTRDSWAQSFRFFCPYDVDEYKAQKAGTAEYNPYLKYGLIQDTLYDGIHSILLPPKVGSYDEGGKPWTGKGGEGITVHYNPQKPNKRMSMCYMFAAFGIPFAWEFYTGQRSNTYNENKHNTPEERAYGKTISRMLRLFRRAFGDSKGMEIYMDNLFSSVFLFYLMRTFFEALCVGTHRKNDGFPELSWEAKYKRGDIQWATAKYEDVPFVYVEYGDNKVVRFLSTKHGSPHTNPGRTQERWDSDTRTYQDIFLPQIKLDYDAGMMWVDFADFLESFVRIQYNFRRPYLVNYFWCFETAVTVSHQVCKLLWPDSFRKGGRSFYDDLRALCRSIVLQTGTIRRVEQKANKRSRRAGHVLAFNHPPTNQLPKGRWNFEPETSKRCGSRRMLIVTSS
ncbi:hypothetical protein CYMTET_52204 [Cymbomonas tetramitiformis]|uniref:PiggyBac transposable element-derived protein domain-containing protein n=1 Tax=Cymbomonas tetramitiformis TaxID=36881 RepID=A0AAE0ERB5_9CHLO|nr:hypothetical protein CYMTET_52204 [Cymbomonas tetramitiformis]